jgi:hypothetical protein
VRLALPRPVVPCFVHLATRFGMHVING